MKTLVIIAILYVFIATLLAQNGPGGGVQIQQTGATPSGACGTTQMRLKTPTGALYSCQSGTWAQISGGGGGAPTGAAGGDLCSTYPNPTVCKVNGGAVPTSGKPTASNGSGQLVDSTAAATAALFGGTCPAGTTSVLGTSGTNQCITPFPFANQHGSYLITTMSSVNAGVLLYPFGFVFAQGVACSSGTAQYWLSPASGWLRSPAISTNAATGSGILRANYLPDCVQSAGSNDTMPTGGVFVPPGSAQGGYVNQWSSNNANQVFLNQFSPLAFEWTSQLSATTSSIPISMGAEFISSDGTTDSIVSYLHGQALTASSSIYLPIDGVVATTQGVSTFPFPVAGTLRTLIVTGITTPAANATVTVLQNGSAPVSGLTITIPSTTTTPYVYADLTDSISVAAGDYFTFQATAGASTQTTLEGITMAFVPTDGHSAIIHGLINAAASTTQNWTQPFGQRNSATETTVETVSPVQQCSAQDLYVYQAVANGAGVTTTYTLYKNGTATAITGTTATAFAGSSPIDLTHIVTVNPGDRLSLSFQTNTGTGGAQGGWSLACK